MPILGVAASGSRNNWGAYATGFGNYLLQIGLDSANNIYSGGFYSNASSGEVGTVFKVSPVSALQWQRSLTDVQTAANQETIMWGTAVDSSGNVYLSGQNKNSSNRLIANVTKHDTTGSIQWQRHLTGPAGASLSFDGANGVSLDTSGDVYLTGFFKNTTADFGQNAFVAKYNSSGSIQWQRQLVGPLSGYFQFENGQAIDLDSSNNVFVAGLGRNSSYGIDAFLAKYNSSGTIQWQRQFYDANSAADRNSAAYGVRADSAGNPYIVGQFKNTSGGKNAFIAKYNTSGSLQWQASLADANSAGSQDTYFTELGFDSSDNVYAIGYFKNTSGGRNGLIVKYDSSGTIQWQRSIVSSAAAASQAEALYGIIFDSNNTMCISGNFIGSGASNGLLLKLPSDGSRTGTYTLGTSRTITYGVSTLTTGSGVMTSATGYLTDSSGSLTDSAGTLTDAAGPLTYAARRI